MMVNRIFKQIFEQGQTMKFVFKTSLAAVSLALLTACGGGGGGGGGGEFNLSADTQIPAFMSTSISIEKLSRIPINSSPNQTLAVVNVIESAQGYSVKTRYEVAVNGLFYDTNDAQLNDLVKAKIVSLNKSIQGVYRKYSIDTLSSGSQPPLTTASLNGIYEIESGISKIELYKEFSYPRQFFSEGDPALIALLEIEVNNLQPQLMRNYVEFDIKYVSQGGSFGFGQSNVKTLVEVCLWKNHISNIKRCDFIRIAYDGAQPNSSAPDFRYFIGNKLRGINLIP
jgi:hypothetical protein